MYTIFLHMEKEGNVLPIHPAVHANQPILVSYFLRCNLTVEDHRQFPAQLQKAAIPAVHILVLTLLIPEHASAAIRVMCSGHSHFITVINHWHTGHQKLQCSRQLLSLLVLTAQVKQPGCIMASHQIPQQRIGCAVGVASLEAQISCKCGRFCGSCCYKVQDVPVKGIVHYTVPLVTL